MVTVTIFPFLFFRDSDALIRIYVGESQSDWRGPDESKDVITAKLEICDARLNQRVRPICRG
jgi:hypothetical protein